ncbi:MAG: hypothetical protein KC416_08265 [Myxococcales bacterium]|nr:hypothetical protein [Myxococcales bacterium]
MDLQEYEELLSDAEKQLDRLRALYDLWFQGFERLEPTVPKAKLDRTLRLLQKNKPRNSALRFRANQLWQRWGTYQTYWKRTARQIEEGTYRKHIKKARKRFGRDPKTGQAAAERRAAEAEAAAAAAEGPKTWEIDPSESLDLDMDEVERMLDNLQAKPAAAPKPSPAVPPMAPPAASIPGPKVTAASRSAVAPPGPAGPGPGLPWKPKPPGASGRPVPSPGLAAPKVPGRPPPPPPPRSPKGSAPNDQDMRRVYDRYVQARKRNNEKVDNLAYDKVAAKLQKMIPDLQKKHKGKRIEFEVVLKDGKVGLKPVAKD